MITIDFETRSKADIKWGACRYASDPSTQVLCLVYAFDDREPEWWCPFFPDLFSLECPIELKDRIESGELLEAHYSGFEANVWYYQMVKKYGWPRVDDEQWRCSASKAARLALPRDLSELNKALMTPIQKDMTGRRVMLKMSKPKKPSKKDPSIWHEKPEDFLTLIKYCDTDVQSERSSSNKMPDLDPQEQRVWFLDQQINLRGIYCDTELAQKMLDICEKFKEERTKDLVELTEGEVTTPGQRDRILDYLKIFGVNMPNLQADTVDRFLEDPLVDGDAYELLKIKKDLSKTSVNKIQTFLDSTMYAHRICDTLMYHGASTGRWAGKGIQPHNPPRSTIEDVDACIDDILTLQYEEFVKKRPNVLESLSSCIRGLLCAPPGKELVVADFSAIEARVLFWLSGEEKGLNIYRTHGMIYEEMAAYIHNIDFIENITKDQRQLGKQAVLGCGYGMGKGKFRETCLGYGMDVSDDLAATAVAAYRSKFSSVPRFWYTTEDAAIKAVRRKGEVIKCGRTKWCFKDRFLMCLLPSGRKLYYYLPRITSVTTPWGETKPALTFMANNSVTKKFERTQIWGGTLVENITQAVARDFLVNSLFNVEAAGYRTVLHVHDEIICEEEKGQTDLKEFEDLMAQTPEWGRDCPIAVEGWTGPRFKKA